jgi:hypothetical protein
VDTPIAAMDPTLEFEGLPAIDVAAAPPASPSGDPLGPLAALPGTWTGRGFNAIWRPHQGTQDHFLELNVTKDTIVFTKIPGQIPNRGLVMPDINMFGLTYMQQISEENNGPALHIEPGIWASVPATSNPHVPATVVRMASIPHGTTILAQGEPQTLTGGPPQIQNNNITPFGINDPTALQPFPESNLSASTQFRHTSASVTQQMVNNPNSLLQHDLQSSGQNMKRRVFLHVTTVHTPIPAGGIADTAFLRSASNPPGGNANAVQVDSTFWIETLADNSLQLQYTQRVLLNFNGLSWPHVTVATLKKQ